MMKSKCHMDLSGLYRNSQNDETIKDKFAVSKGYSLSNLEEKMEINGSDLLNGDLGFKSSNKINAQRENDQFYFNPNIANCNESNGLNCAKPMYGQEFAEGWFV